MALSDILLAQVKAVHLNPNLNFVETVVYTPANGSPVSISAIVERHEGLQLSSYPDGLGSKRQITLRVASADVVSPSVNDWFTIDGEQWRVSGEPSNDGMGMLKLTVEQFKGYEKSAQDYRISR